MEKQMRLKKTLYAGMLFLAVASMVVPSVRGEVRGPKRYALNRDFASQHRAQLQQAQNNYLRKPHTPRGTSKPLANNGLLQPTNELTERLRTQAPPINVADPDNVRVRPSAGKVDSAMAERALHPGTVAVTPELRQKLQLRPSGAVTETAQARQSRLQARFAEA
jgi:hypothetical protein